PLVKGGRSDMTIGEGSDMTIGEWDAARVLTSRRCPGVCADDRAVIGQGAPHRVKGAKFTIGLGSSPTQIDRRQDFVRIKEYDGACRESYGCDDGGCEVDPAFRSLNVE
ncbi:hypothetical protein FOZ62_012065, partial [Perkinsus olseni]